MEPQPLRCPFAVQRDTQRGMHPLHLRRSVLNREILRPVLKQAGIAAMPDDPHIVLAHSDDPVNWDLPVFQPNPHRIAISPGKPRFVRRDGDTLIALEFDAPELEARWAELRDAGARWEGAPFVPRILLGRSDQPPPAICFFSVPILFGPEWRATPDCLRPGGRGPAT